MLPQGQAQEHECHGQNAKGAHQDDGRPPSYPWTS
jgi:hypothetical protein